MNDKHLPGLPDLKLGTIFCIGRNYVEHARELNSEVPEEPVVFLKPATSVIYEGDAIELPSKSTNVHHEVELVVALSTGGKNISEENALSHIAGYAVGIDVTARDIQQKAKEKSHPWAVSKGFDTFAPLSSFISVDKISDPQNLDLTLTVNGKQRQHDNTRLMIFPVTKLIAYLSGIFTLQPGDLIFTGTPKGVSPIKTGDNIKATLGESLATLSVTVK
jgi:2-keto-4-pentenoate hydratase/2-oxohepta-3-ene-1,7-dioic acid hydratase in catechol pathway